MKNRYDVLKANEKKVRNSIETRTNSDDKRIEKYQAKIASIKYKRTVFISKQNNKLTDIRSLIKNEQERIFKDMAEEDFNKTHYDGKVKK